MCRALRARFEEKLRPYGSVFLPMSQEMVMADSTTAHMEDLLKIAKTHHRSYGCGLYMLASQTQLVWIQVWC